MFVLYSNLDLSASLMTTCLYLERKKLADDSISNFKIKVLVKYVTESK